MKYIIHVQKTYAIEVDSREVQAELFLERAPTKDDLEEYARQRTHWTNAYLTDIWMDKVKEPKVVKVKPKKRFVY